jgi:hypothetical protein
MTLHTLAKRRKIIAVEMQIGVLQTGTYCLLQIRQVDCDSPGLKQPQNQRCSKNRSASKHHGHLV